MQQVALNIDRVEGAYFSLSGVSVALSAADTSSLELKIAEVTGVGFDWRNVRVACPDLRQERGEFVCDKGTLEAPAAIPLSFRYAARGDRLDLALRPGDGEEWRVLVEPGVSGHTLTLAIERGQLARLAAFWPPAWPRPSDGRITGKLVFTAAVDGLAVAGFEVSDLAFSDESGMHAGDKVAAALTVQAQQHGDRWQWQGRLDWHDGEVYWQPVFMRGVGQALSAAGTLEPQRIVIENGRFAVAGVGDVGFTLTFDRKSRRVTTSGIEAADIDLAALYEKLLKPALQNTELDDLRAEGRVDVALQYHGDTIAAIDVTFKRVSLEDKARRFGLFGVNGNLPWRRNDPTTAQLQIEGGEILRVPFGAFDLPLEMRGIRVRMRKIRIPVLDGGLTVDSFGASGEDAGWRWRFHGTLAPVSMEQLTTALGLPPMHGSLSADIPDISYRDSKLAIGGALSFKIFDGTITVRDLALEDPLGKLARLTSNVEMRGLDLELLTRTYSFGNITGRIDGDIRDLEFVDWDAVRFDARVASSAGEYPRRISQAAVQNITALGGAGAAAAIQRSFLRFFDQFGYSALGLSCKLDNGICRMGGIADTPQGYVIVKGGGVPALSVLGYNRHVGWSELLQRLKRITQGASPVIK